MIAAFIINSIAVLLSWLARYQRLRFLLSASFFIYTVFLGIRYMWGNDMTNYYDMFRQFNSVDNDLFNLNIDYKEGKEYGWMILNILCKPIGFFGMQMLLAVFQNYILYIFIRRNVTPNWYWFATLIYGFGMDFMVLSASMMRQFLAMIIFILSSYYVANNRFFIGILLVFLAASMHQSAWILLPFCFLGYLNVNFKKNDLYWIALILILWLFLADLLSRGVVEFLMASDIFSVYENYMGLGVENSDMNWGAIIHYLITCLLLVHIGYMSDIEKRVIVLLTSISFVFVPLMSFGVMIARIGYYFSLFSIIGYPVVMQYWRFGSYSRNFLVLLIVFLYIRNFFGFFNSEVWHTAYYEYHTIFEAPYWM